MCVRYTEKLELKERFLGFVDCSERADATGIYGQAKHCVMSCHINGVQQKLRQDHPFAMYMHCMAHKLNLVLVDTCKVNRTATMFFQIP